MLAVNEADLIEGCLASLTWADELLVVDEGTRPCRQLARRPGLASLSVSGTAFRISERGLSLATGDWVLFVDADERVPPSLAREVRLRLADPGEVLGFWVPRRNIIAGQWVRHAGWWPDCSFGCCGASALATTRAASSTRLPCSTG